MMALTIAVFAVGLLLLASPSGLAAPPTEAFGDLVVHYNLSYREGTSRQCTLDLALPKGRADRPRPAILVIHGGGWLEGDKSSFVAPRTPGNILEFAAAGFVAAAVNYRLSGEAPYPAGLDDCQSAVRWLRSHAGEYQVDPNRMGAYGNSAGGHLALLLGLIDRSPDVEERRGPLPVESSRVQAVVSDSGPLDLLAEHKNGTIKRVIERFLGGPPAGARLAEYRRASPINHLGGKAGAAPVADLRRGRQPGRREDGRPVRRGTEPLGSEGDQLFSTGRRGPLPAFADPRAVSASDRHRILPAHAGEVARTSRAAPDTPVGCPGSALRRPPDEKRWGLEDSTPATHRWSSNSSNARSGSSRISRRDAGVGDVLPRSCGARCTS